MIAKWSYRVTLYLLLSIPVLAPLFYLPVTTDYYQFNKLSLFYALTGLALISWIVYCIAAKTVRLTIASPLLPIIALATAAIVATITASTQSSEVWLHQTAIYLAGAIFFILTATVVQTAPQLKTALLIISSSVAIAATAASLNFNPTGSDLNLATLILGWLPATLVLALKSTDGNKKIAYFVLAGVMISGLILNGYKLLPGQGQPPLLLNKTAAWSIAVDTLKTKLFFGTGPGRFNESFTQFKPIRLNLSEMWAVNFNVSANVFLEILTTMGLVGLTAFIWLINSARKIAQRQPGTRMTASQLALTLNFISHLILGLFFPFTPLLWIMFFTCLSLLIVTQKSKQATQVKDVILTLTAITAVDPSSPIDGFTPQKRDTLLPIFLAIPIIIGLSLGSYYFGKAYAAEYYFNKSLIAANNNDGNKTYDLQIKTIELSPNVDRYRISYSNTNLALANSLAGQENLSDQDRQTVATLIQQAIREARIATQISPNKASAWANLGNIYKNLVNFAQGAEEFAQAAYTRAIQLDPANPGLRLDLGGLNYTTGKYDLAAARFTEATQLKPNFANAYYNLSYTYQKQEKWLEAYQAMQQVSALTPSDGDDAAKVDNELKDLEAKLPKNSKTPAEASGSGQLAVPSPAPQAPEDLPKIEL